MEVASENAGGPAAAPVPRPLHRAEGGNLSLRTHPVDRILSDGYVGIQHVMLYRFR